MVRTIPEGYLRLDEAYAAYRDAFFWGEPEIPETAPELDGADPSSERGKRIIRQRNAISAASIHRDNAAINAFAECLASGALAAFSESAGERRRIPGDEWRNNEHPLSINSKLDGVASFQWVTPYQGGFVRGFWASESLTGGGSESFFVATGEARAQCERIRNAKQVMLRELHWPLFRCMIWRDYRSLLAIEHLPPHYYPYATLYPDSMPLSFVEHGGNPSCPALEAALRAGDLIAHGTDAKGNRGPLGADYWAVHRFEISAVRGNQIVGPNPTTAVTVDTAEMFSIWPPMNDDLRKFIAAMTAERRRKKNATEPKKGSNFAAVVTAIPAEYVSTKEIYRSVTALPGLPAKLRDRLASEHPEIVETLKARYLNNADQAYQPTQTLDERLAQEAACRLIQAAIVSGRIQLFMRDQTGSLLKYPGASYANDFADNAIDTGDSLPFNDAFDGVARFAKEAAATEWIEEVAREFGPAGNVGGELQQRARGRPSGTGAIDDSHLLSEMKALIKTGEASNPHRAAQIVAPRAKGASEASSVSRLRRKYRNLGA